MPKNLDPRLHVDAPVQTRARLVTAKAQCQRLYGSNWNTKVVYGRVQQVITKVHKGRRSKHLLCKWKVGAQYKTTEHPLCSIQIADAQSPLSQNNDIIPSPTSTNIPLITNAVTSEAPITPTNDLSIPRRSNQSQPQRTNIATPTHQNNTNNDRTHARTLPLTDQEIIVHDRVWKVDKIDTPINGDIPARIWQLTTPTGEIWNQNCSRADISVMDAFLATFPLSHLNRITSLTSENLALAKCKTTTTGEVLKIFGIMVLITRLEFGSRRDLWKTTATSKYIPTANFGSIISRDRFEQMMTALQYSKGNTNVENGTAINQDISHQERWKLVNEFVDAINAHRQQFFRPSSYICVDESMSRWYGAGGSGAGVGLPHYVAIDRKPESGCEIHSACDGASGVLIRLKLVTGSQTTEENTDVDENVIITTATTLELTRPWLNTNRVVCADSWFSSVGTAAELLKKNTKYIGVVKTGTKEYPMKYLGELELETRGEYRSLLSKSENGYEYAAVLWMDRDRKYFISTTGDCSTISYTNRERLRVVDGLTERVNLRIPIPRIAESYFEVCAKVDNHNRLRQDGFRIERKLETNDWSDRVNHTFLGMCIVDAYIVYKNVCSESTLLRQSEFYVKLAEELIDNNCDGRQMRKREVSRHEQIEGKGRNGIGLHLKTTDKRRKDNENAYLQGRCNQCKRFKSKLICSACRDLGCYVYTCNSDSERLCFEEHINSKH